ncbi:MAG: pyridoxal phosphate-dependent aminotransferase, partial [Clostridiales bacterium]|nr:pyridoxal phosphate-dependent aminotransferase [Clostridiales bacterium]
PQPYLDSCAICTAPSKTFNLAGIQASNLLISNRAVRERLRRDMGFHSLNALGYQACRLAYDKCEGWLDALLVHLDGNRQLVEDFLAEKLPCVKPFRLEGTYLMWLDCRALGLDKKELERFMQQEARLFCDEGYLFGRSGEGFERLNLACPRWVLEQALERLEQAVRGRFPALTSPSNGTL